MSSKISIFVAEDHLLMRKALVELINSYAHFQVVGEAGNGRELLRSLRKTKADIVLLDLEMPVMNGWQVMERLAEHPIKSSVVVLSQHVSFETQLHFISKGAKAYLPKNCDEDQFVSTLLEVNEKGYCFDEKIVTGLIGYQPVNKGSKNERLSLRELEVLKEIGNGLTDPQIAEKLNITKHTVHSHRMNMMNKTKTHNAAELIKFAVMHKII